MAHMVPQPSPVHAVLPGAAWSLPHRQSASVILRLAQNRAAGRAEACEPIVVGVTVGPKWRSMHVVDATYTGDRYVPALVADRNGNTPYFSRLSARSALYTDLCLLVSG